ncbi:MAG: hypothetical protein KF779_08040 [Hyphomonadaceae bacterium]|nr:hypothetical protein [Hyphomonadaceae bacterium]
MESGAPAHEPQAKQQKRPHPIGVVLGLIGLVGRIVGGSVLAIALIAFAAVAGASQIVNLLIEDGSVASILFLLMLSIVLADLIAKFIGILGSTFPDLVPKLDDEHLKRASLIRRLRPGQTVALLSGANAARVVLFLVMFALLGLSYAATPATVQQTLFGTLRPWEAIEAFLREGVAGSIGYFLFFLGPGTLKPMTDAIVAEPLTSPTVDGDLFLVGLRLYGLAFVLAILRTLVTPIVYLRARLRAHAIPEAPAST